MYMAFFWKPEEGDGSSGIRVTGVVSCHMGAETGINLGPLKYQASL